jgi:uncharacterized protein
VAGQNVKDLIKKLVALQKFDTELYEYKRGLKDKPAELEGLKEKFEAKKQQFHELETSIKQAELARKKVEGDLKNKEDDIVKANAALMTLKTNKEYQIKLFEIENLKADKSILEDEILRSMETVEKLQQDVVKEKEFLAGEEKKYLAEKEKIDAAIRVLEEKVDGLAGQRREAAEGIDKNMLAVYERVIDNRGGIALVPVVGMSCGGCFMNVPEQTVNRMKMYEEVVRCEMCARFIYLPEDL